jgi:hypothetical protein
MKLCHYAECHCAECCDLFIAILNVVMLSVIRLNVIRLNVVMLSVVAPFKIHKIVHRFLRRFFSHGAERRPDLNPQSQDQ